MRPRAPSIPRALGHRYILPPNAQRYTVRSDRRLWPLVGFLALLGGLKICHDVGKNDLTRKKEVVTKTNEISPEFIQNALDQAKEQPFLKDDEEKLAYLMQEHIRSDGLCKDGSFLKTPIGDSWLTGLIRIEGDRSSNMLV